MSASQTETSNSLEGQAGQNQPGWVSVAVVVAVVALVRFAYSFGRTEIHLAPDEYAIAGAARFLSGSGDWNMLGSSTWQTGAAALLAPINWVTSSPHDFVRAALGVNAVVAGIAAAFLLGIGRQLSTLRTGPLQISVILISCTPAALSASAFVWAEPLVSLCFNAVLYHLLRLHVAEPRIAHALAACLWAAVGYAVHSRLLPLVPVTAAAALWPLVGARRVRASFLIATSAALGLATAVGYSEWIRAELWEFQAESNTASAVIDRLLSLSAVAVSMIGQVWYLAVAYLGVVALGVVAIVQALRRGGDSVPSRRAAVLVLLVTAPLILVSVIFMAGRTRPDYLIYGRYNDAVVGPLLILGVGWLKANLNGTLRSRSSLTAGLVGGALVAILAAGLERLHAEKFSDTTSSRPVIPMVAGIQPLVGSNLIIRPLAITVVVLLLIALLIVGMRPPRRFATTVVFLTLLVTIAGYASHRSFAPQVNSTRGHAWVRDALEHLETGETIYVGVVPDRFDPALPALGQFNTALAYQWYLPEHPFRVLTTESVTPGIVVLSPSDDRQMRSIGSEQLWLDGSLPMALWRVPSDLPSR